MEDPIIHAPVPVAGTTSKNRALRFGVALLAVTGLFDLGQRILDATLACIAFVFDSLGFDKSDHTISLRLGAAIFAAIPFLDGTVVALIDRFFRSQVAPVSVGDLPTPANEIARHLAFRNLRFSQQSEIPAALLRVREDVVE